MARKTRKIKATAHERTRARQTGAPVKKLRAEQDSIAALQTAKQRYADRGDVNSRGDWLAVALKDAFRTKEGSLDLAAFKACLKDNGLNPPNVDMVRHGAIGRFRMCAALMLHMVAKKNGCVVIGGKRLGAFELAAYESERSTRETVRRRMRWIEERVLKAKVDLTRFPSLKPHRVSLP